MFDVPRLWARIPALVRGAVVACVILSVGQLPPGIFLVLGLRYTPETPWWLAATAMWLWLFWQYLNGRWWPSSTSRLRSELLRASSLSPRVWVLSLSAGVLAMVSVLTGALLTGLVAELPAEAYSPPFDLGPYAQWTVFAFFLNVAVVAGVVEEAAFRGYMISIIERRHGWTLAVVSAAALFYVAHLGHAYATVAFAPFFLAYSILHGLLVFLTRSILPSVVLHAAGDLTILPMQYGIIDNPLGSSIQAHVVVIVSFAALSALPVWLLARVRQADNRASSATHE